MKILTLIINALAKPLINQRIDCFPLLGYKNSLIQARKKDTEAKTKQEKMKKELEEEERKRQGEQRRQKVNVLCFIIYIH